MEKYNFLSLILLIISIFNCVQSEKNKHFPRGSNFLQQSITDNKWDYYDGGESWQGECALGNSQSPINILSEKININGDKTQLKLVVTELAKKMKVEATNTGTTIKVNGKVLKFTAMDVDNKEHQYEASWIEFHAPSEHLLDSNHFNLEMQIGADDLTNPGSRGILSIFFETSHSQENPLIDPFAAAAVNLAHHGSSQVYVDFSTSFRKLFEHKCPEDLKYITYVGSLTSPPCSSPINWYIIKGPIPISVQSLSHFQSLWENNKYFAGGAGNYREPQDVNSRKIRSGQMELLLDVPTLVIPKKEKVVVEAPEPEQVKTIPKFAQIKGQYEINEWDVTGGTIQAQEDSNRERLYLESKVIQ